MDPFVEDQVWPDFHHDFISGIREALSPALRPRYVARIEERVYLQYEPYDTPGPVRPDVTVLREMSCETRGGGTATAVMIEPLLVPLPMPEEVKEAYLEVRLRETHEVVAVIEVLSPANKRPGSTGQREYLSKREAVLQSQTHLVEIDLLRGGQRMPTAKPLPACDYVALVSRGNRRPMAQVWAFGLRHRLPVIPVPLAGSDPDVPLDLQDVFSRVYDRAGYDYSVDYKSSLDVLLAPKDQGWISAILAEKSDE
jgi:hypothetical protein